MAMTMEPTGDDGGSEECDDGEGQTVQGLAAGDYPAPTAPQYPANPRFQRAQFVLAGQGGVNPCFCCSWMCSGTCSLMIGCVVIATVFIALGTLYTVSSLASMIHPIARIVSRVVLQVGRTRQLGGNATFNTSALIQLHLLDENSVIDASRHVSFVVLFEGLILLFLPGILLFIASFTLNKIVSLIFGVLVACGVLYDIIGSIYLTVVVYQVKLIVIKGSQADELKTGAILYIWLSTLIEMIYKSYAAVCAFAFFDQISHGEYYVQPFPPYLPLPGPTSQ